MEQVSRNSLDPKRNTSSNRIEKEGKTSLGDSESEWVRTISEIRKTYTGLDHKNIAVPLYRPFYALPVEQSLIDELPLRSNSSTSSTVPLLSHNVLHVEPLIDLAAELIERILRNREQWNALGRSSIDFDLALQESIELDKVHSDAVLAGLYTLPYELSEAEVASIGFMKEGSEVNKEKKSRVRNIYEALKDRWFSNSSKKEFQDARTEMARISGKFLDSESDSGRLSYAKYSNHGEKRVVAQIKMLEEKKLSERDFEISLGQIKINEEESSAQEALAEATLSSTNSRETKARLKRDFDEKNIGFQSRQTEVRREITKLKGREAIRPGGPYNFPEQMKFLIKRLAIDYQEAYSALISAQEGLRLIYNYQDESLPKQDLNKKEPGAINQCVLWVDRAVSFLQKFSRLDQNYILPVSVRAQLGEEAWERTLKDGVFKIALSTDDFPEQSFVRIRGVGAFVVEGKTEANDSLFENNKQCDLWQMQLKGPEVALVRYDKQTIKKVDQSNLPKCFLARVSERNKEQKPDVVGIRAYHNASPIGKHKKTDPNLPEGNWIIQISSRSLMGRDREVISDIHIDFHLAVRSIST